MNKPYEREEYFKKVSEIKDQLRGEGLYGEMLISGTYSLEDTMIVWPVM